MTDIRKLLHRAWRSEAAQVRLVAGRPPAIDHGDGRFVASSGRAVLDDSLSAFLLDHVSGFDVPDIFSDDAIIGELELDGTPCRVIKQRRDGVLAVQVQLRKVRRSGRMSAPVQRLTSERGKLVRGAWNAPERPTAHVPAVAAAPGHSLDAAEAREAVRPGEGPSPNAEPRTRDPEPRWSESVTRPTGPLPPRNVAQRREPAAVEPADVRSTEVRMAANDNAPLASPSPLPPPERAAPAAAEPAPRSTAAPASRPRGTTDAMDAILDAMVHAGASDVHVSSAHQPWIRVDGVLEPLGDAPPLGSDAIEAMAQAMAPDRAWEEFQQRNDTDFAYERGRARFRINLFRDRNGVGLVARCIPVEVPSFDALGLPEPLRDLCQLRAGLVLVTGPTGSGKSTTLAALIDLINRQRAVHVVTVEDPIEYTHTSQRALVNQREVGQHTDSFPNALRAALREDPDVVLIGELRDLETTRIALKTAETGHLVFGTLHTGSATTTVDRIVNQFPGDERDQVRLSLSESLRAVASQALCRKKDGGRAMAMELLLGNRALANLIREARTFQIPSLIQTARGEGMQLLNDALLELVAGGQVDAHEALRHATDRNGLREMLRRAGHDVQIKLSA